MIRASYYFPTVIFSDEHDPRELRVDELCSEIYAIKKRNPTGVEKSNVPKLGGWHSESHLHKIDQFGGIVRLVETAAQYASGLLGYHPKTYLRISSMWAIINPPGGYNKSHIHPKSLWSDVFYLKTPTGCGNIEFKDPRVVHLMNEPLFTPDKSRPHVSWSSVSYTPSSGKLLLFPSWIYHSTEPNMADAYEKDGDRIIFSFNLDQSNFSNQYT